MRVARRAAAATAGQFKEPRIFRWRWRGGGLRRRLRGWRHSADSGAGSRCPGAGGRGRAGLRGRRGRGEGRSRPGRLPGRSCRRVRGSARCDKARGLRGRLRRSGAAPARMARGRARRGGLQIVGEQAMLLLALLGDDLPRDAAEGFRSPSAPVRMSCLSSLPLDTVRPPGRVPAPPVAATLKSPPAAVPGFSHTVRGGAARRTVFHRTGFTPPLRPRP